MLILYTTAVIQNQNGFNIVDIMPSWLLIVLNTFGGMMAALGIGILLSMLIKQKWQFALFLLGFMFVGYLKLPMMAIALFAGVISVLYYVSNFNKHNLDSEDSL